MMHINFQIEKFRVAKQGLNNATQWYLILQINRLCIFPKIKCQLDKELNLINIGEA